MGILDKSSVMVDIYVVQQLGRFYAHPKYHWREWTAEGLYNREGGLPCVGYGRYCECQGWIRSVEMPEAQWDLIDLALYSYVFAHA